MKFLEENTGTHLCGSGLGNAFLYESKSTRKNTKEKIVYWSSSKSQTFVFQRTPSRK